MGRTANTPASPAQAPELLPAAVQRMQAAQDVALSMAEQEAMIKLGRQIGQIEVATFFGNISDGVMLSAYENIKKSKAWAKLVSQKTGNHFQNLDAFCQEKLGYSARRLAQVTGNRELIGQETFAQAEALGLRQVDYNAIKTLPAPDQELIRRAVEDAQSRDEVLDLLQELAGRHAKEKENLTKEASEARQEKAAVEKVLEYKNKQIDSLQLVQVLPRDEQRLEIEKTATNFAFECQATLRGRLRQAFIALSNATDGPSKDVFMAGLLGGVQAELAALREEFNLPDVSSAADQALAAEMAQWSN